jgi:hypothetical protein
MRREQNHHREKDKRDALEPQTSTRTARQIVQFVNPPKKSLHKLNLINSGFTEIDFALSVNHCLSCLN